MYIPLLLSFGRRGVRIRVRRIGHENGTDVQPCHFAIAPATHSFLLPQRTPNGEHPLGRSVGRKDSKTLPSLDIVSSERPTKHPPPLAAPDTQPAAAAFLFLFLLVGPTQPSP